MAVHGICLTNPDAVEADGATGDGYEHVDRFLEKYRWPTIDAAKKAALAAMRPR